jgi:hypothetical protein
MWIYKSGGNKVTSLRGRSGAARSELLVYWLAGVGGDLFHNRIVRGVAHSTGRALGGMGLAVLPKYAGWESNSRPEDYGDFAYFPLERRAFQDQLAALEADSSTRHAVLWALSNQRVGQLLSGGNTPPLGVIISAQLRAKIDLSPRRDATTTPSPCARWGANNCQRA